MKYALLFLKIVAVGFAIFGLYAFVLAIDTFLMILHL
jgi:hypothetical protein